MIENVRFLVENLTRWLPFLSASCPSPAKNRFSRRFVVVQKEGACECWQNEFIFEKTAICTRFGAVCRSMERVLVLNGVRFGAKCLAFCR